MFIGEDLRDTEIKELRIALRRDEDVVRFDIPMQDQPAVCILDCSTHGQKDPQALIDRVPMMIAEVIDRLSLHEFHGKVGDTLCGCPAIQQTRNMWMIEPGERPALTVESSDQLR